MSTLRGRQHYGSLGGSFLRLPEQFFHLCGVTNRLYHPVCSQNVQNLIQGGFKHPPPKKNEAQLRQREQVLTLPGHLTHQKSYLRFNTSVMWGDSPQLLFFGVRMPPPNPSVQHGLWLTGALHSLAGPRGMPLRRYVMVRKNAGDAFRWLAAQAQPTIVDPSPPSLCTGPTSPSGRGCEGPQLHWETPDVQYCKHCRAARTSHISSLAHTFC